MSVTRGRERLVVFILNKSSILILIGSCVFKVSMVERSRSTSWSTLNQPLYWYLVNTRSSLWSTFDLELTINHQLMWNDILIECWHRCWGSVVWGLIEGVDQLSAANAFSTLLHDPFDGKSIITCIDSEQGTLLTNESLQLLFSSWEYTV